MEGKTEGVGIQVIANGIVQAVHYYILATQIDKKCERIDALVEASNENRTGGDGGGVF